MQRNAFLGIALLVAGVLTAAAPVLSTARAAVICPAEDLGSALPISAVGSTIGAPNSASGSCADTTISPEQTFLYTPSVTGEYQIDTLGSDFDTVLYIRQGDCSGVELACNDQFQGDASGITLPLAAGEPVVLFVDGFAGASGNVALHVALLNRPAPTPTAKPSAPLAGDCGHDEEVSITEVKGCVDQGLGEVRDCSACDVNGDGTVDIAELAATVHCFLDPHSDLCPRASLYDGTCGNGAVEGSETCDDGNSYGGDGCAANCTRESDLTLNFGDTAATQSAAVVQAYQFFIELPITGAQVLTVGKPRDRAVRGADGTTNFDAEALPFAGVIDKNRGKIDPIEVPGLVCACLRGAALQTCGGRPVVPGDPSDVCTLDVFENIDPTVCAPEDPCKPTFGTGVSLAGSIGCNGARDLDYDLELKSGTQQRSFLRSGGEVDLGGTALTFVALGLITGGPTCATDPTDPRKGPDGVPCTDDDPIESLGDPQVMLLTTGRARGTIVDADSQTGRNIDEASHCASTTCQTVATGVAKSCADLVAGDTSGLCVAGVSAELSRPSTGDVVIPARYCAVP